MERRRIGDIHVSGGASGRLVERCIFHLVLFGCDRNLADTYFAGEMELRRGPWLRKLQVELLSSFLLRQDSNSPILGELGNCFGIRKSPEHDLFKLTSIFPCL